MKEELIKYTKSLSPLSLKAIDAKIIQDDGSIYLVKEDETGHQYKTLVEKNPELYFLLTKTTNQSPAKVQFISTYISAKCNLACKVCYEGNDGGIETRLEDVKELLHKHKDCGIALTGMEPTCREEIFDFIEMAGNKASLITNGIKLKDIEYVQKLKRHGLKKIFFSFNGTNNEIYRKMNGGNLLEIKLEALKNIELKKIDTLLSATLAKGINEDQILPLVEFCFAHRSFIIELRLRTLTPVGRYLDGEQIFMSELIDLVANALSLNKADIIKEFCFIQEFIKKFRWLLPKGFRDKYGTRLCSFIFHVKRESGGRYSSPGELIDLDRINGSFFKSIHFLYYIVKAYGILLLMDTWLHVMNLPRFVAQKNILNITLKCWPNIYNIDLDEMSKCPSGYYKNGEMDKFCISNIKYSIHKENTK